MSRLEELPAGVEERERSDVKKVSSSQMSLQRNSFAVSDEAISWTDESGAFLAAAGFIHTARLFLA